MIHPRLKIDRREGKVDLKKSDKYRLTKFKKKKTSTYFPLCKFFPNLIIESACNSSWNNNVPPSNTCNIYPNYPSIYIKRCRKMITITIKTIIIIIETRRRELPLDDTFLLLVIDWTISFPPPHSSILYNKFRRIERERESLEKVYYSIIFIIYVYYFYYYSTANYMHEIVCCYYIGMERWVGNFWKLEKFETYIFMQSRIFHAHGDSIHSSNSYTIVDALNFAGFCERLFRQLAAWKHFRRSFCVWFFVNMQYMDEESEKWTKNNVTLS